MNRNIMSIFRYCFIATMYLLTYACRPEGDITEQPPPFHLLSLMQYVLGISIWFLACTARSRDLP